MCMFVSVCLLMYYDTSCVRFLNIISNLRIDILMLFFRNGNTFRWRSRMHWTPHCHFHSLHSLGNICGLEYLFKMFDAIPILLFLWTNHYTGANRSRKLWQSFRYQRNTSLYYNGQYKIRFKMVVHAYVCFWLYFVNSEHF